MAISTVQSLSTAHPLWDCSVETDHIRPASNRPPLVDEPTNDFRYRAVCKNRMDPNTKYTSGWFSSALVAAQDADAYINTLGNYVFGSVSFHNNELSPTVFGNPPKMTVIGRARAARPGGLGTVNANAVNGVVVTE